MTVFSAVLLVTHVPAVYGLALTNDTVHEAEHAAYLATALLMWAPLLGVDPLPHRVGPRGQAACLTACMAPMLLVGAWLGLEPHAVYHHYVAARSDPPRCAARPAARRHDHVGGWAAGVRRPGPGQTYELASASLTG